MKEFTRENLIGSLRACADRRGCEDCIYDSSYLRSDLRCRRTLFYMAAAMLEEDGFVRFATGTNEEDFCSRGKRREDHEHD